MHTRQILLITTTVLALALALLHSPPQPTQSATVLTGNITVVDSNGTPLPVVITSHGQSERSPTVAWIASAPHISIRLDALESKGVGAEFQINNNSPGAQVILESHTGNPEPIPPPGTPIRFVTVSQRGIHYSTVTVSIAYSDAEVGGDEERLLIYHYKNGAWQPLPTTVDAEANIAKATASSLSTFALVLSTSAQFNASILVYNTQGNGDPADDTLTLSASHSNLQANGTTHDFGYLGSLYANQTYVVELRLQPNATYQFDADYFDETILKAGYPFSMWDNTTLREYLINTTLVTNDSTRGEDIFVSQSSGVDYSVDANVGEAGTIRGDVDVVVLERTNERTYWFENPGWGAVQIENADPDTAQVRALAVGDLERDGDVDVVVGNDNPNILIYENDGTPEGANWNYQDIGTPSDTVRALAVADLDNDGYPDIISGESATSLKAYQNDGTPFNSAWSTVKTVDSGFVNNIETIATGDVDRDGYTDIVTGEGLSVFWYRNPGDPFSGSWSKYNIDTSLGDDLKSVSLGDLDGDGDLDVVATTKNDDVLIYENDGTPTGWSGSSYTVKSSAGGDVEDSIVGDIDGDEVPDIAVVVKTAYDVLWFKNDGTPFDGGWSEYTVDSNTGGQDPKYIAGGDIDSDGDLDLVVGVAGTVDDVYWYNNSNPTNGEWTVNVIKSLADDPRGVAVIDIDNDANHNVLDYYVSGSENVEEGADEFGGWSSLSGAQNYSFYFIVTPDNNWGADGVNDNVTFYLGNESNTGFTESRVHSAIRYPL